MSDMRSGTSPITGFALGSGLSAEPDAYSLVESLTPLRVYDLRKINLGLIMHANQIPLLTQLLVFDAKPGENSERRLRTFSPTTRQQAFDIIRLTSYPTLEACIHPNICSFHAGTRTLFHKTFSRIRGLPQGSSIPTQAGPDVRFENAKNEVWRAASTT